MLLLFESVFHLSTELTIFVTNQTVAEATFFEFLWQYLFDNRYYIFLIILLILIVYATEWIRYSYKLRHYVNPETINLGQITVHGELEKIITGEQLALVLKSEFSDIKQCLDTMAKEKLNRSPAQAASVDYYFFFSGIKDSTAITLQNTSIPTVNAISKNPVLQSNIILGIGSFKIPVSEILRSLIAFAGLVPVLPRSRYNRSLINISLISHENNAKVIVHREGTGGRKNKTHLASVTSLSSFQSMDDLNSLLRDMAFMVLGLQEAFENNCHWKSMRYLLDGFNEFTRFRNSGLKDDRDNAKLEFHNALLEDPENNFQALYYCAVMLMVERTTEAIEKAINYFMSAQRSKNAKLHALINLGLTFCYAQSHHRLGKGTTAIISSAEEALKNAKDYWINKQNTHLPLIPYLNAMLLFVKSSHAKEKAEKEKMLNKALGHAYKSTQLDPDNSMFKNNIGWALMYMAKSGINKLQAGVLPSDEELETAVLAEKYLLEALLLNPKNKLTHANLCLLYSIPYFIKKNDKDEHKLIFLRSRYHGMKAISLDKNYINGYRDLCFAYIRYNKEDEAEKCFHKALELAETPCKDAELFKEILAEAKKYNISDDVLKKWSKPEPGLFEPH